MKLKLSLLACIFLFSCQYKPTQMQKIIFLHHSTGQIIWRGKTNKVVNKLFKISEVENYFKKYNRKNKSKYYITERYFPSDQQYGWKNFPYDYYNIWVKNAGIKPYLNEPTLEILTKEYNIIIFKHCFPVSNILEDTGKPDINSEEKRLENYKLQYLALKEKMHEFPDNNFIVWTPAVHIKGNMTQEEAERTHEFYKWIMNEWDEKGDNILIWDFYKYETEDGLYLLDKYARKVNNSHPNKTLAAKTAPLFAQFIINVAEGKLK